MLSDRNYENLINPIINYYAEIEQELLLLIANKFDIYEEVGVSRALEWYLHKLNELGSLNSEAVDKISEYSNLTRKEILKMLEDAGYGNLDIDTFNKAYKNNYIKVDPVNILKSPVLKSVIDNSYKDLDITYKMINTKAVESTKQIYMDVLNKTYIEVSSGIYDYNTSIRKGIEEMASKGIYGATYKRDDTIVKYSLEATIRRDTLTAVHQCANECQDKACKELGVEYVEVSSHFGARVGDGINNHAHWQGKIYKLDGSTEEYKNFYEETGYGEITGLGGVNCRHTFWPFFPGIMKPSQVQYNEEDNRKQYELVQKQREYERKIRKLKNSQVVAKDKDMDQMYKDNTKKLKFTNIEYKKFLEDNDLRRDFNREYITDGHKNDSVTDVKDAVWQREQYNRYQKSFEAYPSEYSEYPQTFDEFLKMKYNDISKWEKYKQTYRHVTVRTSKTVDEYQAYSNNKQIFIPKDALITNKTVIAGGDGSKVFRNAKYYTDTYGGKEEDWSKVAGKIDSKGHIIDIHWVEYVDGKKFDEKIKEVSTK